MIYICQFGCDYKMCADTVSELHSQAVLLNISRKRFKNDIVPHYILDIAELNSIVECDNVLFLSSEKSYSKWKSLSYIDPDNKRYG